MKAARLLEPRGPVVIEEVPIPTPGPGEVRLQTEACGLCHSDLFIRSLPSLPHAPVTLGHEAIATIEQLGPDVDGFKTGDRVGLTYLYGGCGSCESCEESRPELCARQLNTGYHVDGAFAEFVVARAASIVKAPPDLPASHLAPLCCAGWTAYHAVAATDLEPGSWLAIYGIGGLGHLAIQFAKLRGLRVAAVDLAPEKLSLASELGAEITVNSQEEDPSRLLRKKLKGAHAAISFAASASAVGQAFASLRRNGILILVGLAAEKFELPLVDVVLKQIRIHGSFLGRREEIEGAFEIARRGDLRIEVQTCSLEDLPQAMDDMQAGKVTGRTVVTFPVDGLLRPTRADSRISGGQSSDWCGPRSCSFLRPETVC